MTGSNYDKPTVTTYRTSEIVEWMGPAQANASGGGGSGGAGGPGDLGGNDGGGFGRR